MEEQVENGMQPISDDAEEEGEAEQEEGEGEMEE